MVEGLRVNRGDLKMYTIKKGRLYVRDSRYTPNTGKVSSYTSKPEEAVKYATREEAKNNACENEIVVKMSLQWN